MNKIFIFSLFLSLFVLSSCSNQFVCKKPYIQVGSECCLDENNDYICDKDRPIQKSENIVQNTSPTIEENSSAKPEILIQNPERNESIPKIKLQDEGLRRYFKTKIFYGDINKNQIDKIFTGPRETAIFYLWIDNVGDYDVSCTALQTLTDKSTKENVTKELFTVLLKSKDSFSKLISSDVGSYQSSINTISEIKGEFANTTKIVISSSSRPEKVSNTIIKCKNLETNETIQNEPLIEKISWFLDNQNGFPNHYDWQFYLGDTLYLEKEGVPSAIKIISNDQKQKCVIASGTNSFTLDLLKTQKIGNIYVTMTKIDFNSCTILFW